MSTSSSASYLLTYAPRSRRSIGHLRPLAIELCSALLWPFQSSWSLAVSALLQCLASNGCQAGLSSSSPVGSRSGLGVWCMLDAGFLKVCSIQPHFLQCVWGLSNYPIYAHAFFSFENSIIVVAVVIVAAITAVVVVLAIIT